MNINNVKQKGFTLVELAIVLVIVGLLVSAFLTPLSAQLDQSRNAAARRDLQEIKETLLGFVIVNSRLPCPDTDGNGTENCAGFSPANSTGGNLPWADLGLKASDPWGRPYQYRVNNAFTTNFSFITPSLAVGAGVIEVCTENTCTAVKEASNVPVIVFSLGKNGPPVSLDEQENTDGDGVFVSHDFSDGANTFDDLLVWISSNLIMNRMVATGKLP